MSADRSKFPGELVETAEAAIACEPLIRMFGDSAKTRVLMTLDVCRNQALRPGDICDHANISRRSWYNVREDLLDSGLVEEGKQAGNAPMYTMPDDDARVRWFQYLVDFFHYDSVSLEDRSGPDVVADR